MGPLTNSQAKRWAVVVFPLALKDPYPFLVPVFKAPKGSQFDRGADLVGASSSASEPGIFACLEISLFVRASFDVAE